MNERQSVELQVYVTGLRGAISLRISPAGERWAASVEAVGSTFNGIGASAREALTAALMPLGSRAATEVMAAPAMFSASARLIAG